MDWDNLKVVLAVSRTGSLTAAARQLGMDQTTAGRRLSALEDHLGTPLFMRAKSGFVATSDGQIVIGHARRVEARLGRMRDQINAAHDSVAGLVRIRANNWMLQRFASGLFPDLLRRHPGLELRLSGRLPPITHSEIATLSFWFDAEPVAPDMALPFARFPYAAFRRDGMDEADPNWVQFRDDEARGPSFSRIIGQRLPKGSRIRLTATDAQILLDAVRSGTGQGILPVCLAEDDPTLRRASGPLGHIDRVLHVHVDPDIGRTRRVQVILHELRARLGSLFGAEPLPSRHPLLKNPAPQSVFGS